MSENQINENNNNTNKCNYGPYIFIIILLIIISGLSFFLGLNLNKTGVDTGNQDTNQQTQTSNIEITIIDDTRCFDCQTEEIVNQISGLPFLAGANIEKIDFSEDKAKKIMEENNIRNLPAILFNTNSISDFSFTQYLEATDGGLFNLNIGATFNPYEERSERGFTILEDGVLDEIKSISYVYGNIDAEITWIEYSDFGCAFCIKMHAEDKTPQKVFEIFGDNVNNIFQHMAFRNSEAPEVIECIAKQGGKDMFYDLIHRGFDEGIENKNDIYALIEGENINIDEVEECISSGEMKQKMSAHMSIGQNVFNVTGTPGNILINNKTGEYVSLPGAYPASEFEKVINELME